MTTFLLIPGADGRAWYWHRVVPELEARGHCGIAVDLPLHSTAGLADYADAAVAATGSVAGGTRLGITMIHTMPGGHLNALSRPVELADQLISLSAGSPSAE